MCEVNSLKVLKAMQESGLSATHLNTSTGYGIDEPGRNKIEEMIDKKLIEVNGKIVKPSYEIKIGDIVEIKFGDKTSKFEIIKIPKVQEKNITESIRLL